jgi:ABC-type protease/lipase transport system fused ATPase/permease subunit
MGRKASLPCHTNTLQQMASQMGVFWPQKQLLALSCLHMGPYKAHMVCQACLSTPNLPACLQLLVEDLSFSVPPGAVVGIIGGNGAGGSGGTI